VASSSASRTGRTQAASSARPRNHPLTRVTPRGPAGVAGVGGVGGKVIGRVLFIRFTRQLSAAGLYGTCAVAVRRL
jgi:hypothetical protein